MNPEDRITESVKQADLAAEADAADEYAEAIIDNAVENLERAGRRLERRRKRAEVAADD